MFWDDEGLPPNISLFIYLYLQKVRHRHKNNFFFFLVTVSWIFTCDQVPVTGFLPWLEVGVYTEQVNSKSKTK